MPILSTRKIRRKIRSVQNIKKITRAMEMVAAAKLKKVQGKLIALRPFAGKLQEVMENLVQSLPPGSLSHPLMKPHPVREGVPRTISLVVVTSNKGLCGSYNTKLLAYAGGFIREQNQSRIKISAIGKKAADYFNGSGRRVLAGADYEVVSTVPALAANLTVQATREMLASALADYEKGRTDEIWITYTEFVNALTFRPRLVRLVPIRPENGQPVSQKSRHPVSGQTGRPENRKTGFWYFFEPEPDLMMNLLVPRYLETTFYRCLLDAQASEFSARMMAMRNATSNADEAIDTLTLTFNKARQASITKELLDIVGGAEVMR